jgi:hypothetical protein
VTDEAKGGTESLQAQHPAKNMPATIDVGKSLDRGIEGASFAIHMPPVRSYRLPRISVAVGPLAGCEYLTAPNSSQS